MYPENYHYTKEHEWILVDGDIATIGITHHAQDQLGDIVYVELPETGEEFSAGDEYGTLESVKAVAEYYAPVDGEVIEVNELLEDHPEQVNKNPHESGWLVKIKMSNPEQLEELMDAAGYKELAESEA